MSHQTIESISKLLLIILSLSQTNGFDSFRQQLLENIYYQPFPEFSREALYFRFPDFDKWERPEGPIKIGIQIGHMIDNEPPPELKTISRTGAIRGALKEVEINKLIGYKLKQILENKGYKVEILPAIIPIAYYADVFIAIHTNIMDENISGFMISEPYIDYSGKADKLKEAIIEEYQKATGLKYLDKTTKNMTHYYAFNWSKFKNTIHPKTPGVIIELGNMNNDKNLLFLILGYQKVALGLANGIEKFLKENY